MTLNLVTHLNFAGRAREALEFYQSVFGGQLVVRTYAESGVPNDSADATEAVFDPVPAGSADADHVSFGMVMAPNGFRIAAYDVVGAESGSTAAPVVPRAGHLTHTESFFVVLNADSRAEVEPLWAGLADGGAVIQGLGSSPFGPTYGMVSDRFGVTWIVSAGS